MRHPMLAARGDGWVRSGCRHRLGPSCGLAPSSSCDYRSQGMLKTHDAYPSAVEVPNCTFRVRPISVSTWMLLLPSHDQRAARTDCAVRGSGRRASGPSTRLFAGDRNPVAVAMACPTLNRSPDARKNARCFRGSLKEVPGVSVRHRSLGLEFWQVMIDNKDIALKNAHVLDRA